MCVCGAGAAPSSVQDDLHSVLRGRMPRLYGEMPAHLGSYERIAPATDAHTQVHQINQVPPTAHVDSKNRRHFNRHLLKAMLALTR